MELEAMVDSTDRPAISRRTLLGGGTAAVLSAWSYGRVVGANDRVGLGFIGFGLIGKRHVLDFRDQPGTTMAAIAEVHRGRRDEAVALLGGSAQAYGDFRALLDDRTVDAVVISTPDHWHALMTMMACSAGKDVYVEKPLTLFIKEGRWMVDVARRYNRLIQVGTQNRSGPQFARARQFVREGKLGEMVSVQSNFFRNAMPGFGNPPDQDPPQDLDWDMMLGPAPYHRYNPNRGIYHFRWFWDYSGGQMTNLGHHALDIMYWYLGGTLNAVSSSGGRFALEDNGETPDTQDALFEIAAGDAAPAARYTAVWSHREAAAAPELRVP